MNGMIKGLMDSGNETLVLCCLVLAVLRIYLEVIQFDFSRLPLTGAASDKLGKKSMAGFHRTGLYLSIGYVLLFGPGVLLN